MFGWSLFRGYGSPPAVLNPAIEHKSWICISMFLLRAVIGNAWICDRCLRPLRSACATLLFEYLKNEKFVVPMTCHMCAQSCFDAWESKLWPQLCWRRLFSKQWQPCKFVRMFAKQNNGNFVERPPARSQINIYSRKWTKQLMRKSWPASSHRLLQNSLCDAHKQVGLGLRNHCLRNTRSYNPQFSIFLKLESQTLKFQISSEEMLHAETYYINCIWLHLNTTWIVFIAFECIWIWNCPNCIWLHLYTEIYFL